MSPDDLLERMAAILRREIGPAVEEPFAKTQAFMAAVVLEKLGRQLRLADDHTKADREDLAALAEELDGRLGASPPGRVSSARLAIRAGDSTALGAFIEALYAERGELGDQVFEAVLGRVRPVLRARLDRQLEHAS